MLDRRDRTSLLLAGPSPGPGRRDAGLLQHEGGGRFVDAALDGAGIVPHRDAELAQGMQHAEIDGDLLEAPARHEQDERAARQMVAKPRDGEACSRLGAEAACRERNRKRPDPPCPQGPGDAPPMPFLSLAEQNDVGRHQLRRRSGRGWHSSAFQKTSSAWPRQSPAIPRA